MNGEHLFDQLPDISHGRYNSGQETLNAVPSANARANAVDRYDAPDPKDLVSLISAHYNELRFIAAGLFKHERLDHTLQPTALVHESFIRLKHHGPAQYDSRGHFFSFFTWTMRHLLDDYARAHGAQKRGGDWQRVDIDDLQLAGPETIDWITLARIFADLDAFDKEICEIAELRVFAGLSSAEIASLLGIGESTARAKWKVARTFLAGYWEGNEDGGGTPASTD